MKFSLIRVIAIKELKESWRDGKLRIAAIAILFLLLASLLIGARQYREQRSEQAVARQHDHQLWLSQGERNPHSAAHFGRYAFKPATPVALLDWGVNSYLGVAVWLEAHYQNPFRYRPAEDASSIQRFGSLTAAVVLQTLAPLLIILLTFTVFAYERETGTLKQLLSLGIAPADLAAGKLLGTAAMLSAILAPAIVIGVLALWFAARADSLPLSVGRAVMMAVAYASYFAVYFGLGVAASALAKSSRAALLSLLGFWLLSTFLVPRAAADLAQAVSPAPSAAEFWKSVNHDISQGIDGHNPADKRRAGIERDLMAKYHVSRVADLPLNFDGWMLQAGEEHGNQVFDLHYGRLWDLFRRQNRIQDLCAIVAPLLAVRDLSMSLAGTDFEHHRHFATQAERYRRNLNRMMNGDMTYHSRTGDAAYMADAALWSHTPDFTYSPPSLAWALSQQTLAWSVLLGWLVFANALAWVAVKRIRPE